MPAKERRSIRGIKPRRFAWKVLPLILVFLLGVWGFFSSQSRWDEQLPLTLVIAGHDRLGLLQLDPAQNKAKLLIFPDNLLLGVAGMGSQYQAKTLWRVGEVESRTGELVSSSVAAFMGVWVDGYIYDPAWEEGIPLSWSQLGNQKLVSNLSIYELGQLVNFVSQLRTDQKLSLIIPDNIQEEVISPDGYKEVTVNEQRLAILTREQFSTPGVLSDRRTVAVTNASAKPGMARLLERMIYSSGGAVVEVTEGQTTPNWCVGRYSGEDSGVVLWLTKRLGCKLEKADWERARAEIELTLGEEWGERFKR